MSKWDGFIARLEREKGNATNREKLHELYTGLAAKKKTGGKAGGGASKGTGGKNKGRKYGAKGGKRPVTAK